MRKLLLYLLLLTSNIAFAQTGRLSGTVKDATTGELLPNIEIYVSGSSIVTLTDSNGNYTLEKIPVGYRRFLFRSIGYNDFTSEPIQITVAQTRNLDVELMSYSTKLDEVQIIGRSSRRVENPPVGVYKLNIQQIEKSPGGNRDISKVVQNLPGVVATPINRNDLIVRGGGPNENKFYLDKIEIPIINHFQTQGASGGNASLVNSDFLNGATLYTSAFPASRGNALSSILDLRMAEGNAERFKAKLAVGASDVAVTFDTPIGKKSNLIASYRVSYLQFLFGMLKLPFLPTYQDAQFKYSYHFDERNSLYLIGLGSFDKNRLNKSLKNLTPDREAILEYIPENDQWSYVVGAVYNHLTDRGSMSVIASTNRLSNSLQKWQNNDPALGKNLDYLSNEIEAKMRFEYNTDLGGGYSLNTGASVDRGFYDNRTLQRRYVNNEPINSFYSTELYTTRYAAYAAIDKVYAQNKLRLNLSARIDGNDYSSAMNNPLNQFSPRLSVSYTFLPKWSLSANAGRYYQEPSYTTMGFRNTEGELINRDRLQYIAADQFTLGIAYAPSVSEQFSVEGFYKGYSRYPMSLIDSTAIGSGGADVFAVGAEPVSSVGKVRAYGVELMYRNDNLLGFMLNTSLTYYYSQYRKLDNNLEPTGAFTPTNWDNRILFNFLVSRSLPKGWDVGLRWRFAGASPTTPYDIERSSQIDSWESTHRPVVDYSRFNSERLPAFHQLDIRVDKTWYFPKWTFSLYVDIQNAYNYKAYGSDMVTPYKDANGSYMVNPNNSAQYLMRSYPNEIGGTIIPTFGIIIEL